MLRAKSASVQVPFSLRVNQTRVLTPSVSLKKESLVTGLVHVRANESMKRTKGLVFTLDATTLDGTLTIDVPDEPEKWILDKVHAQDGPTVEGFDAMRFMREFQKTGTAAPSARLNLTFTDDELEAVFTIKPCAAAGYGGRCLYLCMHGTAI